MATVFGDDIVRNQGLQPTKDSGQFAGCFPTAALWIDDRKTLHIFWFISEWVLCFSLSTCLRQSLLFLPRRALGRAKQRWARATSPAHTAPIIDSSPARQRPAHTSASA